MKNYYLLFICTMIITFSSCQNNVDQSITGTEPLITDSKGGGNNTPGLIQSVVAGLAARLIGGNSDSILVRFTQGAPPSGWTLSVNSNNAAIQVPSTFFVPAGSFGVNIPFTSSVVSSAVIVTLTVSLGSESRSTTIKVFPVNAIFPAPLLQSPGSGSSFKLQLLVTFDWNDNNDAYYYNFQASTSSSFSTLMYDILLNESIYPTNWFDGTGVRYWRVRFVDAGGHGGPWSSVRNFTIRPQ